MPLRERDAQHPLVSGVDVAGKQLCFSASSIFPCSLCSTEVGIASLNETLQLCIAKPLYKAEQCWH